MPNYPKINTGLGKLTPQLWARLMVMLRTFEGSGSGENLTDIKPKGLNRPYFLAKITDSTLIAANRYRYNWAEVVIDSDNGFTVRTNGRSGTDALNLCEMSNTASHVGSGVDVAAADYPSGMSMMPIGKCGDDDLVEVLVVMFGVRDEDGVLRSVFSMVNSHDGTC